MIVGLCGYATCGKTMLANGLTAHGYTVASFAAQLKRHIDPLFSPETPKYIKRPVYVALGAAKRAENPDHWINNLTLPTGNVVIDDCRYANEVAWILEQGGIVLYIDRPHVDAANAEEKCSIFDVRERYPRMPIVHNDSTQESALRKLLSHLADKTTLVIL